MKISNAHRILVVWIITSIWGIIFVYSSSYRVNTTFGSLAFASIIQPTILFLIMFIFSIVIFNKYKIFHRLLKRTIKIQFYFSLISLAVVLFIKMLSTIAGVTYFARNGSYQVIPLGPVDFQPLEFFKVTMILFFATTIGHVKRNRSYKEILNYCIMIFVGCAMILFQPDTGGFLITAGLLVILVFINGEYFLKLFKWFMICVSAIAVLIASSLNLLLSTNDYRSTRLISYLDPFSDPANAGNNIINSALAISNGSITGVGYLESAQSSGYLFAAYTDFIFAIICEELGIFGAVFTVFLLYYISALCFKIASKSSDRFSTLYCYGFGCLILIQSFVNIAGVTGLIPMTGVTLPYISSGINSYFFLTLGLFYVIIIDLNNNFKKRENK